RLYGRKYYTWSHEETALAKAPAWLLILLTQAEEQRHSSQQGFGFASSTGEKWLREALNIAREGNRNATGSWPARRLRTDRLSQQEALRIVLSYANRVPQ